MDLESYLMSKQDLGVSPDKLKELGKGAAMEYSRSGKTLNDSIKTMVKEAGLNLEQTKRVVEHANVATFHILFKKGYGKNVNFPVADAEAIYSNCDRKEKVAHVVALPKNDDKYIPGQELGDMFDTEMEKTASADSREVTDHKAADTHRRMLDQQSDLDGLVFDYTSTLASLDNMVKVASEQWHFTPDVIGSAIESANPTTTGLLAVIKEELGERISFGALNKLAQAGMMPAMGNPITGLTQDLDMISQKMMSASMALEQTKMAMTGLLAILAGPAALQPTSDLFQGQPQPGMDPGMAPPQAAPGMAPPGAAQGVPPQGA